MATAKKAVYKKAAAKKAGVVLRKDGKPDRRYSRKTNSKAVETGMTFKVAGNRVILCKNGRHIGSADVHVSDSSIGCGIKQVHGLGQLNRLCEQAGRSLAPQMVASLLTSIRNRNQASHVILSNNQNGTHINHVLNHIATASKSRVSPRTNSNITVWTF